MNKSTRHSKIAGDFGEALALYWLSKHGFESARVDHTGIDLIARDPETGDLMGISVKSRTRTPGKETTHLNFKKTEVQKVELACAAFGCHPWFSFVVDAGGIIRMLLMPMSRLLGLCPPAKTVISVSMRPKSVQGYLKSPDVRWVELRAAEDAGWPGQPGKLTEGT